MNKIYKILVIITFKIFFYAHFSLAEQPKLPNITLGNKNAPIEIKEFFSLTCSHCANFHNNTFPKLKKNFIETGKIKFQFIDYPLDRLAMFAASISRSLPRESYLDTINVLLKNQKKWAYSKDPVTELFNLSKLFGITKDKFEKILSDKVLMQKILDIMEEENSKFNINSTPTFVINDKHTISGFLTYDEFLKKLKDFKLLN